VKTISASSVINPTILVSGVLIVAIILIGWRGASLPLLSNPKVSLAIVLILGMAMCAQGGLGAVAATGQWSHPLAIVGYILGGAILLVAAAGFFGLRLPFVAGPQQAVIVMAVLIAAKVLNSLAHALVSRA
jgi:hypothetical protein